MSAKIITGLSFEEYTQIEAVNFSTLKHMDVDPLHYLHAVENGTPEKPSFGLGRAAHTAVLEPAEWLRRYLIKPAFVERIEKGETVQVQLKRDVRMKEWRELLARAAAEKKSIISEADNQTATIVAQRVLLSPSASKLMRGKVSKEVTIQWTHAATGLVIRSRLDLANETIGALADLKTAASLVPREFFHSAAKCNYPAQCAMYADAWHAVTGDMLAFKIIAVEKSAPFDVVVVNMPEEVLEYGRNKYEGWLEQVARCRDSGIWPGAGGDDGELDFCLPSWAYPEDDDEITTEDAA